MITRMTSLAALVAAGMTLAACQEEEAEVTTEETTAEQEVVEDEVVEEEAVEEEVVEEETAGEEVATEDQPEMETITPEPEVVSPDASGGSTEPAGTTDESAAEVEIEENATAPTEDDMAAQPEAQTSTTGSTSSASSTASQDAQAAEVDSQASGQSSGTSEPTAAELERAAELEAAAGGGAGSDQNIEELLTTENFDKDAVVAYLEDADIDDNTRQALTQAVEQVDTSNEAALNALISRLEIALGVEAESGDPAAATQ